MLQHLRLTVPADLSDEVGRVLLDHDCVTNVTRQVGGCLKPPGDLWECDVAREETGPMLHHLNELGVDRRGSIVFSRPTGTPFDVADQIERRAPGHPDDAVIWESVEAQAEAGAVPTLSFHIFLILAVILAAIAVITDSAILVIGAMVVGPEFAAIAATCAGIALGRWSLAWSGLRLLLVSFALAIVVVTLLASLAHLAGLFTLEEVTRARPSTGFIWHPDRWSFIVALVAGAAGALALAIERTATMVGVFISVTTVPAAGNLALALAVRDLGEMGGSAAQLGANLAGMLISGTAVLLLQRACWPWLMEHSDRWFGLGERRTSRVTQPD